MNNHLRPPQETLLRQYFAETLTLQGFQAPKNRAFNPFLPHFLHILEVQSTSHITKKRRNPYIFYVLKLYHFSLSKTDNPLIIYIFIYLAFLFLNTYHHSLN